MLERSVYSAALEGSSQDVADTPSVLARSTHTQVHDSAAHIHTHRKDNFPATERFFGF